MGDELALPSADGGGGQRKIYKSKCVLILKFILVVVILFWFPKTNGLDISCLQLHHKLAENVANYQQ